MLAVKKKRVIVAAGILALLVMGGVFIASNTDPDGLKAKPRREWKDRALAEIARRSSDSAWVASEIAMLKARPIKDEMNAVGWLSPHIILMTNGEWIVYANIACHEDKRIHDLFLGRASDGNWYYSTLHFCVGMQLLEDVHKAQPASVATFAEKYCLRAFDGHSDECLKRTYPPKQK